MLYRHSVIIKKCLLLKKELLHSKHNLRASIMQVVGGNWSCLASRMLLTAFNPEILSILGNILITSNITNLQSEEVIGNNIFIYLLFSLI